MLKKIFSLLLILVLVTSMATGCFDIEPTADEIQEKETEKLMQEASRQTGMPDIKNFFEKKTLKMIIEKADDPNLITYLYTTNIDGKLIYQGRGIGFGIPYSVQYTNPEYIAKSYSGGYAILPQPDPSGLFKPDGLSATWYLMIDEETGNSYVEYFEPEIIVKQKKAPRRLCAEWSLPDNY